MKRRHLLSAAAAALSLPRTGLAQDPYPSRPISLWLPWPAGGATDSTMRLLAELAGKQLGQKVLVENRGGAGGTLVMPVLQQAAPDGYTIAQMPQPVFRAPHLQRVLWDPIRDTTPIIQISGVTFGVLVPPGSPVHDLEELFALAAAKPGELTIATNGVGTTPHVVLDELFARRGLRYVHVPYKGTSEQLLAIASGQVMAGVNSSGFAPFVDNGRLRLLATMGATRSRRYGHVPTLKELGHGIVAQSPYGVCGPRGLPPALVKTLHDALLAAMNEPQHVAELVRYDQELIHLGPEDYGRSMREVFAAEKRAVERLGLHRGGNS